MRIFLTTCLIIGLILIGIYVFWPKNQEPVVTNFETCVAAGYPILESFPEQCKTPNGRTFIKETPPSPTQPSANNNADIRVKNVFADQLFTSPYTVQGEAKGNWYFEASFPIELYDANNKKIAETYATAQGEWMTTDFVPFVSEKIMFTATTETGTLVLRNSNPSDIRALDKQIKIPVRFKNQTKPIKLYYYDSRKDTDSSGTILCSTKGLVAVNREIPVSQTPIQDAIRLLISGELTDAEKKANLASNFPLPGVSLEGASLSNGTLTLTFTDPNHSTSGGACKINVLRSQIEATAKQFTEVKEVRILPATLFQP